MYAYTIDRIVACFHVLEKTEEAVAENVIYDYFQKSYKLFIKFYNFDLIFQTFKSNSKSVI